MMLFVPLTMILLAPVLGAVALQQLGVSVALREAALAAGACWLGGAVALGAIALARRHGAMALAQAGYGGTVLQMILSLALGAGTYFGGAVTQKGAFLLWMLGLYWLSLLVVVGLFIRVARSAQTPAVKQIEGSDA